MTVMVARSDLLDWEARGFRLVGWAPHWDRAVVEMADPATTCCHPMTTGRCVLDLAHKGRHATSAFHCDACGHTYRGTPAQTQYDGDGVPDVTFCFLCIRGILP